MKQRIISFILAAVMVCGIFGAAAPKADALHLWITKRSDLSGGDYTDSDKMAQLLDDIFDGNINVYYDSKCTNPVDAEIGSYVMKVSSPMYAGPYGGPSINYGSSCWIYAQGVYYTLFKDYVLNNKGQTGNSENIDMTTTATTNCTYENFRAWGVRQGVGAMLRAAGHSMIVLSYDEEKLVTLEGNVDNGLVCVRERSWDQVRNKYSSFEFIVQPKDQYMQDHYDACRHENFSDIGECPDCGYVFNWKRTFSSNAAGYYTLNATCVPKAELPYTAGKDSVAVLGTGELVQVQGSVTNYFGQVWYQLQLEDGSQVYAPSSVLEFTEYMSLQVTVSKFSPADGLALKAASYPLSGIVNSNYPLKKIDAYLDGQWYAAWTASNKTTTQVSLNPTAINMNLAFSKLAQGKHTITMVATDYIHPDTLTFHRSTFYIVGNDECLHSYSTSITKEPTCTAAGMMSYTCGQCGHTYTEDIAALGHHYNYGYCSICGSLDFDYQFQTAQLQVGSGEGLAGQQVTVPVTITQNQCFAKFTFIVNYDTTAMTLTGVTAGEKLSGADLSRSGNTITYNGSKNVVGDCTVFYLGFTLSATAKKGSYPVSLSLKSNSTYYFRDEDNNARDLQLNAGSVECVTQGAVSLYRDGGEQGSYATLSQALAQYDSSTDTLRLNKDCREDLTLTQDLYIDLNGNDLAGTVTVGEYKVYGMDSSTDGYTCQQIGYFTCTDESGKQLIPEGMVRREQKRYAAISSQQGWSFHRFYLGITAATVKPSVEGVGYKAVFAADPMLLERVDAHGFILQLPDNQPVAAGKDGAFVSGDTVTCRVDGYDVKRWGEKPLTAQVYLVLDGQMVVSDTVSYSLKQLTEGLNANAAALTASQKTALAQWIKNTPEMQGWNVENLL